MKRASTLMRYVSSELKKMRETRGWSQRELAEKLKMSRQRVTMIESGKATTAPVQRPTACRNRVPTPGVWVSYQSAASRMSVCAARVITSRTE